MLILLACASPGDLSGTLVDARTSAPIAAASVVLTAGSPECDQVLTTDDAGRFSSPKLCGGKRYLVAPADPLWWVATPVEVDGGAKGATLELRAWRAPDSDGIYLLDGDELSQVVSQTSIDEAMYAPASRTIRFPTELPGTLPTVDKDHALVISGKDIVSTWVFEPLWDGPELTLGPADAPMKVWPWTYIGAKIDEAGSLSVLTATPANPVDLEADGRQVRYLAAGTLPPGRYALTRPGGKRAILLAFE